MKNNIEFMFSESTLKGNFYEDDYTYIKTIKNPNEEILLFIVHGIGQSKSKLTSSLNKIKECVDKLYSKFKILFDKQLHVRIIDWKRFVDIGDINKLMDVNTNTSYSKQYYLGQAPTDLLYYIGKNKNTILNCVINQMNFYYSLVKQFRSIIFKGSVSCLGHSLGSVILYDILSNMDYEENNENKTNKRSKNIYGSNLDEQFYLKTKSNLKQKINPLEKNILNDINFLSSQIIDITVHSFKKSKESRTSFDLLKVKQVKSNSIFLNYQVNNECLCKNLNIISLDFNLNSLIFNIDQLFFVGSPLSLMINIENGHDACLKPMKIVKDFHNIIHPMDPVAFRIEPLIKNYPFVEKSYSLPTWEYEESRKSIWITIINYFGYLKENNTNHDDLINRKRYDFMVRESNLERVVNIVGVLFSHISYWTNVDVFYFILKMCHWQGYHTVS